MAVPVGGRVAFVNDDEIHHNVFSLSDTADFDSGIYGQGGAYGQKFSKPGPVEILCNIHANMNAYIYVVDSPYFAVASGNGRFRIPNLMPGRYRLQAWHKNAVKVIEKTVAVHADRPNMVHLAIGGDRPPRGPAPDKYGQPRQEHIGY